MKRMLARRLTILLVAAFSGPAVAEAAAATDGASRTLGGHTFQPSLLVAWPFVTTHFGAVTAVGFSSKTATGQDENGNASTYEMSLGSLAQAFDSSIAFTDWLAVHLAVSGNVQVGANITSALSVGAIFLPMFGGGVAVRLLRTGAFQLSVGADVVVASGVNMNPLLMIANGIDRKKLLIDVGVINVDPAARVALGLSRVFGIQSSFGLGFTRTKIENPSDGTNTVTKDATLKWGVALSLDFASLFAPLGLLGGYQINKEFDGASTHQVEGGLYYTGRPNLTLGVGIAAQLRSVDDEKNIGGQFSLYYVW